MTERIVDLAIVGDLAFDQTITKRGSRRILAGSAYNAAVAASTVAESGSVGVVARVGSDFKEGLEALRRRSINIEGIAIIPDGHTAIFTITEYGANRRKLSADPGVSSQVDPTIFPESYRVAPYVHLSSSHPEKYLTWIPYLRGVIEKNTIISADANDLFIRETIEQTVAALYAVDMVFMNEEELRVIRKKYPNFRLEKPLILKKGSAGASYIDLQRGVEIFIEAPSVEVADTTGAGDTLAGVFLVLIAKGISAEQALTAGVNTASQTVTSFGVEHLNPLV